MDPNFMDMQEFAGQGAEEGPSKQKLAADVGLFLLVSGCVVLFRRGIERALREAFIAN